MHAGRLSADALVRRVEEALAVDPLEGSDRRELLRWAAKTNGGRLFCDDGDLQ